LRPLFPFLFIGGPKKKTPSPHKNLYFGKTFKFQFIFLGDGPFKMAHNKKNKNKLQLKIIYMVNIIKIGE
jgi:hypothetical protein